MPSARWKQHVYKAKANILTKLECRGTCKLHQFCQYYVHSLADKTCYLADLTNSQQVINVTDSQTTRSVVSNIVELDDFAATTFNIRTSTNKYTPFVYKVIGSIKNFKHCGMNCYFAANNKCDFFLVISTNCYLGNFNTGTPVGSSSSLYNVYIYKGD